jgi:hypothetical protein
MRPPATEPVRVTLSKCGEYFTLIDAEFLPLLEGRTFSLHHCGKGKLYARQQWCKVTKQNILLYLHQLIAPLVIGPAPGPGYVIDHEDGDGLNNQGYNFRWLKSYDNRWKYARHKHHPAHV